MEMFRIKIDNPGPKIFGDDICELERTVGFALPGEYRDFLLKYNGGQPTPYRIEIDGFSESPTDVQVFFGVNRREKTSNIGWNVSEFSALITNIGIPIACDSGGALFILKSDGSVLYLLPFEEGSPVYVVAVSFSGLLKALT